METFGRELVRTKRTFKASSIGTTGTQNIYPIIRSLSTKRGEGLKLEEMLSIYRVIHEKCSGDVVSAVCVQRDI